MSRRSGRRHSNGRRNGGGGSGGGAGAGAAFDPSGPLLQTARSLPSRSNAAMARLCSTVDKKGCPYLLTLIKQQSPVMADAQRKLLRAKMETLLVLGANVNGQDLGTGNTAAHHAVLQRDAHTLELLKRFRADFHRANCKHQQPFECDNEGEFRSSMERALNLAEYETSFAREVENARRRLFECGAADVERTVQSLLAEPFFRTATAMAAAAATTTTPFSRSSDPVATTGSVGADFVDLVDADVGGDTPASHQRVGSGGIDGGDPLAVGDAPEHPTVGCVVVGGGDGGGSGTGAATAATDHDRVHPAYLVSITDHDGNSMLIAAVNQRLEAVSYTHLTLPTIYSV